MTADEYLKHWRERRVWEHLAWPKHQRRFDVLARECGPGPYAEVGCGFGHSTYELQGRRPGDWTAIDFFDGVVKSVAEFFPGMRAVQTTGPGAHLGRFGTVVCSEVLEHVEADGAFAAGLLEMATDRIVISTPAVRVSDPGHLRVYTAETLAALFRPRAVRVFIDGPFLYAVVSIEGA